LALEAESLNNFDNLIIDLESNDYVFFRLGYQTFIFGFIHKLGFSLFTCISYIHLPLQDLICFIF